MVSVTRGGDVGGVSDKRRGCWWCNNEKQQRIRSNMQDSNWRETNKTNQHSKLRKGTLQLCGVRQCNFKRGVRCNVV